MYFLKAMGLGVWGSREEDILSRLSLSWTMMHFGLCENSKMLQ